VELDLRRTELLVLGPGLPKLGFQVLLGLFMHLEEFHQGVRVLLLLESLLGSAYLDQLGLQSLYLGPSVCLELGGHVLLNLFHVVVIAGPGRVLREGLEGVGGLGGGRSGRYLGGLATLTLAASLDRLEGASLAVALGATLGMVLGR
jgi:hypothetical protein